MNTNNLICAKEAADILGVSTSTIYRYIKEGVLPHVRVRDGGAIRIRRKALERIMEPVQS